MTTSAKILVVGDTPDSRALVELLGLEGYRVQQTPAGQMCATVNAYQPAFLIADVAIPLADGLALLHALQNTEHQPRAILMSSRSSDALKPLGVACLTKPIDLPSLRRLLDCSAGSA